MPRLPHQHTCAASQAPAHPKLLAELPLREWPLGERPVERVISVGAAGVSDAELLAAIFGSAGSPNPVALAQQLIAAFGGWRGLQRATPEEIQQLPGVGRVRAVQIKAALELGRRMLLAQPGERLQIRSPSDAAQLLMAEMSHLDQEELRVVCLDTKNRVQKIETVYKGSLNSAIIRVGEVFKTALKLNSAAIVVAHNHPSGDANPSPEDVLVTRQIVDAGKLMDVATLDHLVIGHGRFVSLREKGLGFGA